MDTREVIESYINTISSEKDQKNFRKQTLPDVIIANEEKLGKTLPYFDIDEIKDLVIDIVNHKQRVKFSAPTWMTPINNLRKIINWYSENVEEVDNKLNDTTFHGRDAVKMFLETTGSVRFTKEKMEYLLDEISKDRMTDYKKLCHVELFIRLAYDGICSPEEACRIKESDVDFKTMSVRTARTDVKLSKKTFDLLLFAHNIDQYKSNVRTFYACPYNGSYIKFWTTSEFPIQDVKHPYDRANSIIQSTVSNFIAGHYNEKASMNTIFYLGVYDRLKELFGERFDEMLFSKNPSDRKAIRHELLKYRLESDLSVTTKTLMSYAH